MGKALQHLSQEDRIDVLALKTNPKHLEIIANLFKALVSPASLDTQQLFNAANKL